MSESSCGPGPFGVVGIIADLGLAVGGLEKASRGQCEGAYFFGAAKPMTTASECSRLEENRPVQKEKKSKRKKFPSEIG